MIEYLFHGRLYKFETDHSLFSPMKIDKGTECLLKAVNIKKSDKVLDLGCGYGVVGILTSQMMDENNVYMSDVSETAVSFALKNAKQNGMNSPQVILSDGFSNIPDKDFSIILSNPPYHVDFKIPKEFIESGFRHLRYGGRMYMVTRRKDWYMKKLIAVFGGVRIHETDGYYVFEAEKRKKKQKEQKEQKEQKAKKTMSRKLSRKYAK